MITLTHTYVGPGVYRYFAKFCWYILVYTAYTSIKGYEYEYEISVLPYPLKNVVPNFNGESVLGQRQNV